MYVAHLFPPRRINLSGEKQAKDKPTRKTRRSLRRRPIRIPVCVQQKNHTSSLPTVAAIYMKRRKNHRPSLLSPRGEINQCDFSGVGDDLLMIIPAPEKLISPGVMNPVRTCKRRFSSLQSICIEFVFFFRSSA